jgi:hypothetical protein
MFVRICVHWCMHTRLLFSYAPHIRVFVGVPHSWHAQFVSYFCESVCAFAQYFYIRTYIHTCMHTCKLYNVHMYMNVRTTRRLSFNFEFTPVVEGAAILESLNPSVLPAGLLYQTVVVRLTNFPRVAATSPSQVGTALLMFMTHLKSMLHSLGLS